MVMHFFIWTIYLHVILGKTNPDFLSILSFCQCLVVLIVLLHYVIEAKVLSLFSLLCKQFYLILMEHCVIQTLPIIMPSVKCFKRYCLKFHVCCIFVLLHQLTQQVFHRQVSMEESPSLRNSLLRTSVASIMKSSVVSSYLIGISKEQENSWMIRKPSFGGNLIQPYTR